MFASFYNATRRWAMALGLCLTTGAAWAQQDSIDFESLAPGTIVDEVFTVGGRHENAIIAVVEDFRGSAHVRCHYGYSSGH